MSRLPGKNEGTNREMKLENEMFPFFVVPPCICVYDTVITSHNKCQGEAIIA